jgi:hypothetical protein
MARKKVQKSNPTASEIKVETNGPYVLDEYFCLKEMQPRPVTMAYLEMVAEKLVEYADFDDSLTINKFYRITKIPKDCMQRWKELCPRLNMAYNYALAALGERREEGSITRKYDTGGVWKRQYQFGEEYKQAMEFAAKLAKKDDLDDAGGVKFIVMHEMRTDSSMEKYFNKPKGSDDAKKD